MNDGVLLSRRRVLKRMARLAGTLVVVDLAGANALADAKVEKSQFQYQGHPHDGKSCASCRFFTAGSDGGGTCALVEGQVSPAGWCLAYAVRR
jgi:hypothetical protein